MNVPQRIVLILGAVALLFVLASAGSYQHVENGEILQPDVKPQFANIWDWQAAVVRSAIISVATFAVYLAVGSKRV